MSGRTERASIRLGAEDIDGARAKLENLGTVGDTALRRVEAAGQRAANAWAGVKPELAGAAFNDRAADIAAYGASLDRLRAKFDPLFATSKAYEAQLAEIAEAERLGAINAGLAAQARERATAAFAASNAPIATAAANTAALGRATEGAAWQQRQLAFQLNDVFTSLGSGMPPMQVFIQQGGQIAQVYGTAGGTLRGITALLGGPYVLASAAGAAALGVLVARSANLAQEQRTLEVALRGTGRTAEVSAAQLATYARELEKQGVARADARGIAGDLARTPGLSAINAGRAASLAPDLAAALGTDAAAAAKRLTETFTGGYQAVAKLDDALNILDRDQRRAVRTMFEHGEGAKALDLVAAQLTTRLGGLARDALSPMDTALRDLGNSWRGFMDEIAQSQPVISAVGLLNEAVQGLSMMAGGGGRNRPAGMPGDAQEDEAATVFARRALVQRQLERAAAAPASSLMRLQMPALEEEIGRLRAREAALRAERDRLRGGAAAGVTGVASGVDLPVGGERALLAPSQPSGAAVEAGVRQLKTVDDMTISLEQQNRILAASVPQRVRVRAEIQAENEARDKGLSGAAAEELKRRRVAEAMRAETDARGQGLAAISREGRAALAIAAAAEQGGAAMIRAKAAAEAHAQAATEAGVAEGALTDAIVNRGAAQEAQKAAETASALGAQNQALERLIAAESGGGRIAYYTAIDDKVREATRGLEAQRDATTDPAIRQALESQIELVGARVRSQERLNVLLDEQRRIRANDDTLSDLRDEISLAGASVRVRDRELAQRRELRRLVDTQGADPNNLTAAQRRQIEQRGLIADANNDLRQQQDLWNELGNVGENAAGRIGDALTQAMATGEMRAIRWGNVLRAAAVSAAADIAKLALVNPAMNLILGTNRPSLFAAGGGGGGFGLGDLASLSRVGDLFTGGWSGSFAGGLAGGGGLSAGLFGTAGVAPMAGASFAEGAGATAGLMGSGGSFSLGAAASSLAAIGGGFAVGSMLGGFVAGDSPHRQTNSTIGAAAGAGLGFLVGGPLGAFIGGGIGGLGGGLIGPGRSVEGWGYWLESEEGRLKPIDRRWFNESGAQQFAYADQQVAGVNALLEQRGLSVSGSRNVGGNRNGADASWGGAASFEAAFGDLRFSAANDADLNAAVSGRSFAGPAELQGLLALRDTIRGLTATPAEKLADAIAVVNAQFDALSEQAKEYGLSEDGLAAARERAIQATRDQAAGSGRDLLRELTFGAGAALAPEQQYFAAVSTLNAARTDLEAGGSVDAFVAVARDVLPAARDFLGTTERYAALVADVAGAISRQGGDSAGLGALLQAQVDGTDSLRDTFARYGSQQVEVASATLAELRRLASALEAMLARRVA